MKRILFALALLIAISAPAQTVFKVLNVTVSDYKFSEGKWLYGKPTYPDNMNITLHDGLIVVSDAAKSSYRLSKMRNEVDNNQKLKYSWDALDEKNRPVYLSLMVYRESQASYLTIMYDTPTGFKMYSYEYTN